MIKKYLRVFLALYNIQAKKYAENRFNTYGSILLWTAGIAINILLIEAIFSFTKSINGWSKEQVLFLTGIYRVFINTFSLLFLRSLNTSGFMVARGELDWFLTKPLASQFLVTFRQIRSFEIINVIPGVILAVYAFILMNLHFSLINLFTLVLLLISGLIILYGILFSISTLAFYVGKFESMSSVARILSEPLVIPIDFFGKGVSLVLTFIVPLSFIVTIPVKIFLGTEPDYLILVSFLFAGLLLLLSHFLWNYALKHYTSASS